MLRDDFKERVKLDYLKFFCIFPELDYYYASWTHTVIPNRLLQCEISREDDSEDVAKTSWYLIARIFGEKNIPPYTLYRGTYVRIFSFFRENISKYLVNYPNVSRKRLTQLKELSQNLKEEKTNITVEFLYGSVDSQVNQRVINNGLNIEKEILELERRLSEKL